MSKRAYDVYYLSQLGSKMRLAWTHKKTLEVWNSACISLLGMAPFYMRQVHIFPCPLMWDRYN